MSDRQSSFVDWRFAQSTAALLGKSGPTCTPAYAAATVAQLRHLANVAIDYVTDVTGLTAHLKSDAAARSNVLVVDRWDWVGVNAEGFNAVIAPTLQSRLRLPKLGSASRAVSSATMGVQFGVVLALVSSRVLGQYEFFS
ncbi:MAG: zinc-dependent metalloprotease, partial [Mycobacteriales bacterium]